MKERDALLRAILEDPLDDAPRLVFADWLEESGWFWEATHLRRAVQTPDDQWNRLPLALLQGLHPPAAMPEWTREVRAGRGNVCRGFVQWVEIEPAGFLEFAAVLFAFQPVSQVRLVGVRPKRDFWSWTWEWGLAAPREVIESPVLPKPIYECLDLTAGSRWPSEEVAEIELSRACVRYGRRLAGLSPPVWEPIHDDRG